MEMKEVLGWQSLWRWRLLSSCPAMSRNCIPWSCWSQNAALHDDFWVTEWLLATNPQQMPHPISSLEQEAILCCCHSRWTFKGHPSMGDASLVSSSFKKLLWLAMWVLCKDLLIPVHSCRRTALLWVALVYFTLRWPPSKPAYFILKKKFPRACKTEWCFPPPPFFAPQLRWFL